MFAREHTINQIRARRALAIRRRKPPRQLQPDAIRLEYFKAIRDGILARAHARVVVDVYPLARMLTATGDSALHTDAKRINEALDKISQDFVNSYSTQGLDDLAKKFAERTSDFQRDQLTKQTRALLGVEIPASENVAPQLSNFVAENVALIKSIPSQYFGDIEKTVTGAVTRGTRWEDLAKELQARYQVSESRAKLIARDQVGKFYGSLQQVRQEQMGVTGYTWQTVNDNRVRDEHSIRQGQHFEWSAPPEDGHPGEAINCRCYAEPDFSRIVEASQEPSPINSDLPDTPAMDKAGLEADMTNYGTLWHLKLSTAEGAEAGELRARQEGNRAMIRQTFLENRFKGQGIGTDMYVEAARQLFAEGLTLTSDEVGRISPDAQKVWKRLVDRGLAVKEPDGRFRFLPKKKS
jgi:SPP1 gp7 family putative phage head morphogenesis protein